jgi:hypothetical protein
MLAFISVQLSAVKISYVVRDIQHCRFIVVKLAEIRKEVQCPICLGMLLKRPCSSVNYFFSYLSLYLYM